MWLNIYSYSWVISVHVSALCSERERETECSRKHRLWPPSQPLHTGFIRLGPLRNQQPHRGGKLHTQAASVLTGQKRWCGEREGGSRSRWRLREDWKDERRDRHAGSNLIRRIHASGRDSPPQQRNCCGRSSRCDLHGRSSSSENVSLAQKQQNTVVLTHKLSRSYDTVTLSTPGEEQWCEFFPAEF